ncbi:hypothetical protein [Pseudomonas marginalis]|uniref:hypothetical protein n=1 Tax=Pseudomonas marginalis TaxID=298 RepID=UPI000AD1CE9C|nr:hypothetical protein [Pseudomonas marginalis]MCM2380705.1 hypothetical protein [Pseudomonas marginalis]
MNADRQTAGHRLGLLGGVAGDAVARQLRALCCLDLIPLRAENARRFFVLVY